MKFLPPQALTATTETMEDIMSHPVEFEVRNSVALIRLNRPALLNAINREMLDKVGEYLHEVRETESIHGVILTGTGQRAFSAGADIEFLNMASPLQVRDLARRAVEITLQIEQLGKISVAAINGYALGGGLELAEACMLRLAVSTAELGHPEVQIGAVAG